MKNRLYTIGHSDLNIDQFIGLLKRNEVDVLCDVRSSPYSKWFPHFNGDPLKSALQSANIKYVYLGKELGGRPNDPNCYENNQVNYIRQAQTELFRAGITRLAAGLEKFTPALMCSEKDPVTCHRMLLVTRYLRNTNIEINHILSNGTTETNADTEKRLLDKFNLHPTLFDNESSGSLIDKAYEMQGQQVAFKEKTESVNQQTPDLRKWA